MQPTNLIPHPEGGRFQEVFRSKAQVIRDNGDKRTALTHIYFSLEHGEYSRFHKVKNDEVWNLYSGTGLTLYLWDGTEKPVQSVVLSSLEDQYCYVVPGEIWQAAVPLDDSVLVGCSVAPGFEFEDFKLMEQESYLAKLLAKNQPELKFLTEAIDK